MVTVQAPDYGFNPYSKELKGQYTQNQLDYLNMIALKKRQQAAIAACNKAKTEYNQASQIKVYSFQLLGQIEKKYVSACNIPNVVVIIPKDAADPIDLTNGSMTYSQTLMSLVGQGTPFSFDINYASNITHDSSV